MTSNTGTSLNAVTTAQAGTAVTFTSVASRHAGAVVVTGAGSGVLNVEVSMDNTNWTVVSSMPITGAGTYQTPRSRKMPALYSRANLVKVTGLTVTAVVSSE